MNQSFSYRFEIYEYIKNKYQAEPEYLWMRLPNYAAFRHSDNRKWFALMMDIPKSKLSNFDDGIVEIMNVKLSDPLAADMLIQQNGYFKGYHISRGNWVSVLIDGTVALNEIFCLIDESFAVTAAPVQKNRRQKKSDSISEN